MNPGRYGHKIRYDVIAAGEVWLLRCGPYLLAGYPDHHSALNAGRCAGSQAIGGGFAPELHSLDGDAAARPADPMSSIHNEGARRECRSM